MSDRQETSVECCFITDSTMQISLMTGDGGQFVAISTEIVVPLEDFPLTMELINASHVMLKAMPSP